MNSTGFDLDHGCLIDLATFGTDNKFKPGDRLPFIDRHDVTGAQQSCGINEIGLVFLSCWSFFDTRSLLRKIIVALEPKETL